MARTWVHIFEASPYTKTNTRQCSAVGNVSGCRSRVASLILAWSHNFAEIDHKIISLAIPRPSTNSRRVVVSYNLKYVHEVLVNRSVKLAQEKSGVRCTDRPA